MNIFRLTGDFLHLLAIFILLFQIYSTKSCSGLSGKTQFLYAIVFTARYVDLFIRYISVYNTSFKIIFILSSYLTVYLIYVRFKNTYNREHDYCSVLLLLIPSVVLAYFFNYALTIIEVLWSFSIFLESVAILPQLLMTLRTNKADTITLNYLLVLGSYRIFYILNWMYRYHVEELYDLISISGGIVQTTFYVAFLYIYITRVHEKPYDVTVV